MSQAPPARSAAAPATRLILHAAACARQWWRIYMELSKARLSGLVVVTAGVGFLVAERGAVDWALLGWTVLGASLAAGAANAMNQIIEVERDARMPRTRHRPLPTGRISTPHALAVATLAAGLSLTLLSAMVNALTAGLCLLTIVLYAGVYTPLKVRSTLNTLVGAGVGAIPPMMGWAAASGRLDAGAWVLGATLFIWQIPHFLALAWMYREDYEAGGYQMLPAADPTGGITSRVVLAWSLALLPVTLAAAWIGLAGWLYAAGALLLGCWLLRLAVRFYRRHTERAARKLFLATILYLPLLMALMVLDSGPARSSATAEVDRPAPPRTRAQAAPSTASAALLP